jgi:membrane protein implicated in regulation of membrane protease activity
MSHAAHRLLWTVIGMLLTVIGAVGLAANLGLLTGTDISAPLLSSGLLDAATAPWGLVVVSLLGLLLAMLGLSLLGRLLRTRDRSAMGELTVRVNPTVTRTGPGPEDPAPSPCRPGRTRVWGSVLADGLERDLARDPQVHRASVTLVGTAPRPELWIQLDVGPRARLGIVREHVSAAVDRFSTTSGLHPRYLDVTARVDPAGRRRVR